MYRQLRQYAYAYLLSLGLCLPAAAEQFCAPDGCSDIRIPGLIGTVGDEDTLVYLSQLRGIRGMGSRDKMRTYYFSSVVGGDVPTIGLDTNFCGYSDPCLTWTKALEMCKKHGTECVFDYIDSLTVPFTLTEDLDATITELDPEADDESAVAIIWRSSRPGLRARLNSGATFGCGATGGKIFVFGDDSGNDGVLDDQSRGWVVMQDLNIIVQDVTASEPCDLFDQGDGAVFFLNVNADHQDTDEDGTENRFGYETRASACSLSSDDNCGILAINSHLKTTDGGGAQVRDNWLTLINSSIFKVGTHTTSNPNMIVNMSGSGNLFVLNSKLQADAGATADDIQTQGVRVLANTGTSQRLKIAKTIIHTDATDINEDVCILLGAVGVPTLLDLEVYQSTCYGGIAFVGASFVADYDSDIKATVWGNLWTKVDQLPTSTQIAFIRNIQPNTAFSVIQNIGPDSTETNADEVIDVVAGTDMANWAAADANIAAELCQGASNTTFCTSSGNTIGADYSSAEYAGLVAGTLQCDRADGASGCTGNFTQPYTMTLPAAIPAWVAGKKITAFALNGNSNDNIGAD